ncbi:hypothetical protein PybrP1_010447 [[Pythium] brassicae (nom. inval.)]|nr:hypothetical protein PybrP1_010447 [[Pythium] brassicae (nom. inval.)]
MLLGRRLLVPLAAATAGADAENPELRRIQQDDRFFCETMESIPAQYYFPTDEEENWRRSQPKGARKYHRDVLAQSFQESSKKSVKRAKFTPSEQKTNEERQQETAAEETRQKKQQAKAAAAPVTAPLKANKNPSATSLDGLKERLALKIQAHREQRKADEKTGTKRKASAGAKIEPAPKKRKAGAAFNNKPGKKDADGDTSAAEKSSGAVQTSAADAAADAISYGSLLLADEKKPAEKKTRNGQGIRGIKNLLKKAEKNQQRMAELKQTAEGKAVVAAKQWDKAIKLAAGETVMDDPKLLRNKLKKKEKAKAKSSKEWKQRVAQTEISKKDKQKKRLANISGGRHAAADKRLEEKTKGRKGPRAGFEGKKGEGFLNGDDKKPKKK